MKNVCKVLTAIMITCCLVHCCAWIMHSKSSYPKMNDFYQHPADYDVWFFGTSHVIMGTLPEEMWNEYGIRSYNLACYGQTLVLDYWIARNLFGISKPKLVVIDVGEIDSEDKYAENNMSSVRKMVSSLPFSMEKLHLINDVFEGDLKEEMLLPFSSDHYNWEYLTKDYFVLQKSYELGSDQNVFGDRGKEDYVLVTPTTIPGAISSEEACKTDSLNCEYLRKMIELCRDNGIRVLLAKSPFHADEYDLRSYAYGTVIAREYDIPYFDGFALSDVFDGDTDMWDDGHLNSLGARKYTHELGKFILENYAQEIDTSVEGETGKRWKSRYDDYLAWLDTELPLQSDLYSYLMLCTHPQYSVRIEMSVPGYAVQDGTVLKFTGMMKNCEITRVKGSDCDIHITVFNPNGQQVDDERFTYSEELTAGYEKIDQGLTDLQADGT